MRSELYQAENGGFMIGINILKSHQEKKRSSKKIKKGIENFSYTVISTVLGQVIVLGMIISTFLTFIGASLFSLFRSILMKIKLQQKSTARVL